MSDLPASPEELRQALSSAVLADVLDALGHRTSALPPELRPLRPEWKLFGRAATFRTVPVAVEPPAPFAVELESVDALRPGEVLVATTNGDRDLARGRSLRETFAEHGIL